MCYDIRAIYKNIYPYFIMFQNDPLLEYENILKKKTKIKISKEKVLFSTRPKRLFDSLKGVIRFALTYIVLSGTIFSILMGLMNFSAYSARITNWIDPNSLERITEDMRSVLLNQSVQVSAAELSSEESIENRAVIEEKISIKNPEMVFSRAYDEYDLLSGIPNNDLKQATFDVAPIENRIIIPRLGKNIPLLDVDHDTGASFTEMNEVFMEELKNGVVRYPGTAKPGEIGNAFIFGHSSNYPWVKSNYNDVFALLDTLQTGDEIIVYYDQRKYVYRVTDRAVVKPGDTKVLGSRDPNKKEISLMTCWPIGTTLERMIIFGELVENS